MLTPLFSSTTAPFGKKDRGWGTPCESRVDVGTGGKNHRPFGEAKPNSELRDATAFGVSKLTLKPGAYEWQFIPEAGKSFTASGSANCH